MSKDVAERLINYHNVLEAHPTKVGSDYDIPLNERNVLIQEWASDLIKQLANFVITVIEKTGQDFYVEIIEGNVTKLEMGKE
jgi:hypothetical protein